MRSLAPTRASLLALAAASLLTATTARGADPAETAYDPYGYNAPTTTRYDWSGFYIGAHGEFTRKSWDSTLDTRDPVFGTGAVESLSWSKSSTVFGGHVGYQHQWGPIVVGAELGYSPLSVSLTQASTGSAGLNATLHAKDLYLITGKLGYAAGRTLLYGRAGWATSSLDAATDGTYVSAASGKASGWTTGVGLDYALMKGVIIGAEYGFTRLQSQSFTLTDGTTTSTLDTGGAEIQSLKLRIDLKFN